MYSKVSNPLTIIAIFAGLAEAFATIALIYVPHDIQQLFVYFVMAFPTLIVLIFFGVLIFKHTVLYAPGDYSDQNMFLESIKLNSLKTEVMNTLAVTGADESKLSPQQLENVSNAIEDNFLIMQSSHESFIQNAKNRVKASEKERLILDFIENNKSVPSTSIAKELANKLGFNEKVMQLHINILIRNGIIKITGNSYSVVSRTYD